MVTGHHPAHLQQYANRLCLLIVGMSCDDGGSSSSSLSAAAAPGAAAAGAAGRSQVCSRVTTDDACLRALLVTGFTRLFVIAVSTGSSSGGNGDDSSSAASSAAAASGGSGAAGAAGVRHPSTSCQHSAVASCRRIGAAVTNCRLLCFCSSCDTLVVVCMLGKMQNMVPGPRDQAEGRDAKRCVQKGTCLICCCHRMALQAPGDCM